MAGHASNPLHVDHPSNHMVQLLLVMRYNGHNPLASMPPWSFKIWWKIWKEAWVIVTWDDIIIPILLGEYSTSSFPCWWLLVEIIRYGCYNISLEIWFILVLNESNIKSQKVLLFYCLCYFFRFRNMESLFLSCSPVLGWSMYVNHSKMVIKMLSISFLPLHHNLLCYQLWIFWWYGNNSRWQWYSVNLFTWSLISRWSW